jgi:hypothetical protein
VRGEEKPSMRTLQRSLVLVPGLALLLAAGSATADTAQGAGLCKGAKMTRDGAIKNTSGTQRKWVTCVIPRTDTTDTNGADINFVVTRSTRTNKAFSCVGGSFDESGNLLDSDAEVYTGSTPGVLLDVIMNLSDGSLFWPGYYVLVCLIPPKSTLHSFMLDE